jgi:dodecin
MLLLPRRFALSGRKSPFFQVIKLGRETVQFSPLCVAICQWLSYGSLTITRGQRRYRPGEDWHTINLETSMLVFIMGAIVMAENVYKVIELVGTSTESWEKATAAAINRAAKTLRDLRVAEVVKLDVQLKNGKVEAYRSRISVSFKYESKH